jgi:hypothetical protein
MIGYILVLFIIVFILINSVYILLRLKLQNAKQSTMSASTYRLQMMLYRAVSAQIGIGYGFILSPTIAICLLVLLEIPNVGNYTSFLLTLMSLHNFLDCLSIMYFITPYRKTIMKWLGIKQQRYLHIII